jgi:hypothetical protein
MRKASNDEGLIVVDDKFVGISLGYDYCAEHEWGIAGIKRICGIPESTNKNMGVECRSITNVPPVHFFEETFKKKKFAILYMDRVSMWNPEKETKIPHNFDKYKEDFLHYEKIKADDIKKGSEYVFRKDKDNVLTAWDESSFGVAVMGATEVEYLRELYQAFLNKNVTIAVVNLRAMNPFAGSSMSLLIRDRIPQETLDLMYSADKEYYDREDYEEKIGMKKILQKHGNKNGYRGAKYFMACSPKWINYEDAEKREENKKQYNTKYDIMYWVNYSDDDNNFGWYTVEEIREWMTGKKKLAEIRKG